MRGFKTIASLDAVATGHAFVQTRAAVTTRSPPTRPFMIASGSRSPNSYAASDRVSTTDPPAGCRTSNERGSALQPRLLQLDQGQRIPNGKELAPTCSSLLGQASPSRCWQCRCT
jgi:hypothetical protein